MGKLWAIGNASWKDHWVTDEFYTGEEYKQTSLLETHQQKHRGELYVGLGKRIQQKSQRQLAAIIQVEMLRF